MELQCRECGRTVTPKPTHEDRRFAMCPECDALFESVEQSADVTDDGYDRSWNAGETPGPAGVTVETDADGLRIVRRWRSKAAIGLAVFAALWIGAITWFYLAVDNLDPLLIIFTLPFAAFGVAISYLTICLFLNHTVIETGEGVLSVRHHPLPWPGKRVALGEVDHVYCEEHVSYSDESATCDYLLKAVTRDGKRIKLLSVREGPAQVIHVASAINEWLRSIRTNT
jgi:hypothetical protein